MGKECAISVGRPVVRDCGNVPSTTESSEMRRSWHGLGRTFWTIHRGGLPDGRRGGGGRDGTYDFESAEVVQSSVGRDGSPAATTLNRLWWCNRRSVTQFRTVRWSVGLTAMCVGVAAALLWRPICCRKIQNVVCAGFTIVVQSSVGRDGSPAGTTLNRLWWCNRRSAGTGARPLRL